MSMKLKALEARVAYYQQSQRRPQTEHTLQFVIITVQRIIIWEPRSVVIVTDLSCIFIKSVITAWWLDSFSHQIVASPEFQSKPKRCATSSGAGYTKYQSEMICLELFRASRVFWWQTNCMDLTHRNPHITVTAFLAHRINYSNPQITVTALIVR